MSDGFLHRYFLSNPHKRLHKWFHYFDIYERHFERFRGKQPIVLEIGVKGGGSLLMWREYFGSGCTIIGLDIDPDCAKHASEGIEVFIGSQSDSQTLQSVLGKYPEIDIVIDDGGHVCDEQIASFNALYPSVSNMGVYLIEDVHTSYWQEYGGGLRKPSSFVEFAKSKIDDLNAFHHRDGSVRDFTKVTDSIVFYDSIVVFEKRPQGLRQAQISGPMPRGEQGPK